MKRPRPQPLIEPLENRLLLAVVPLSAEVLANSNTIFPQRDAAIATDKAGNYVLVWDDRGLDGSYGAVVARRFDAFGQPLGEQFRVNTTTWDEQFEPVIAMDAAGNFTIAWWSLGQGIMAQRYDTAGQKVGGEFSLGVSSEHPLALAADDAGNLVLAYKTWSSSSGFDVYAARYNTQGVAQGTPFRVHLNATGDQTAPAVALDADGDFIVSWINGGSQVMARRYSANGTAQTAEFRVDAGASPQAALTAVDTDAAGNFVVAWQTGIPGDGDIFIRRYNASSVALASPVRVNASSTGDQARPSISVADDGQFIVTWVDNYEGRAQLFDASGQAVGGNFRVSAKRGANYYSVPAAIISDGSFAVAWEDGDDPNSSERGIYTKRFIQLDNVASVGDRVWTDANGNGLQDDGEVGRDGVQVWLHDAGGGLLDGVVTSGGGLYNFPNLLPNRAHYLKFDKPVGVTFVVPDQGDDDTRDSDANPITGRSATFALEAGQILNSLDVAVAPPGSLSGRVFLDSDADGTQDPGETGLAAWIVYADSDADGAFDAGEPYTSTAASGDYQITGLGAGPQQIRVVLPPSWNSTVTLPLTATAVPSQTRPAGIIGVRTTASRQPAAPAGTPFRLNGTTTGDQIFASAVPLPDGRTLTVWQTSHQDGWDVFGRLLNPDGTPAAAEFRVNETSAGHQFIEHGEALAVDAAGNFVVAWAGLGAQGAGVYVRPFDAAGQPLGPEQLVAVGDQIAPPVIAGRPDGTFAIAWQVYHSGGPDRGVWTRLYAPGAQPLGPAQRAGLYVSDGQYSEERFPAIAMDPTGRFAVSWQSPSRDAVMMRFFDASGAPASGEVRVNEVYLGTIVEPSLDMAADGSTVVTWESGSSQSVVARRFAFGGSPLSGTLFVSPSGTGEEPAVAVQADGSFVISWSLRYRISLSNTEEDYTVYARRYDSAGLPIGPEFKINTFDTGWQRYPAVSTTPDGKYLISWTDYTQDGAGNGVYARRFDTYTGVSAGDFAWHDVNGDGIQQSGEPGIDGVTLKLLSADGTLFDTTVSAAGGAWRFDTVRPGEPFFVEAVAPAGRIVTYRNAGTDDASDSDADPATGRLGPFQIAFGAADITLDVGFTAPATISGFKFHDADADGGRDFFETGLPGWLIFIDTDDDGILGAGERSTSTAADGSYTFANLLPGTYRVVAVPQKHWTRTTPVAATAITVQPGQTASVTDIGSTTAHPSTGAWPVGPEAIANTSTPGTQSSPVIASDDAGNLVIVWVSPGQDGGGDGVYAHRFSAAGQPLGQEFKVNSFNAGAQNTPAVAMDADGDFVVTWQSQNQDGAGWGVYAQRFDAEGNPLGPEFLVNSTTANNQTLPAIGTTPGGAFIITWTSSGQDGSGDGVYARRFLADGTPLSDEFLVNSRTDGSQDASSIAIAGDGRFVVTWLGMPPGGGNHPVYAQRFDPQGEPVGDEFQVNLTAIGTSGLPVVAMDADGDFAVAWTYFGAGGDNDVYLQRFASDAQRLGSPIVVNLTAAGYQQYPAIAMQDDGAFVVTWSGRPVNSSTPTLFARRFSGAGAPLSGEIAFKTVNGVTPSIPPAAPVAVDADGDFVIAFVSSGDVYFRRADAFIDPAAIGGRAWDDADGDGIQDPVEPGLAGAAVSLLDATGNLIESTMTSSTGAYRFFGLRPADAYSLRFTAPSGRVFTIANAGPDDAGDSDADPLTGQTTPWTPAAGQQQAGFDAGLVTPATLSGTLFNDTDADALRDLGENGLAGFILFMDADGDGQLDPTERSATTAADGAFSISGLHAGTQRLAVSPQGGWTVTTPPPAMSVLLTPGQTLAGLLVALHTDVPGQSLARSGSEFRVNTVTSNLQLAPAVARNAAGQSVVVWQSFAQDGAGFGVYAQLYSAAGAPAGGEFRVNTTTAGHQSAPAVAIDSIGNFVVAWQTENQDGSGLSVYARRFNAQGQPLGGEFRVNTATQGDQSLPTIAMTPAGAFIIAWESAGQDGSGKGVYAQRFAADGSPAGAEFRVNTFTAGDQFDAATTAADGSFTVVWTSVNQDGSGEGIYAQRFSADGSPAGGEFRVNSTTSSTQNSPVIAADADGDLVIAWSSSANAPQPGIFAQRFDAQGRRVGGEFRVSESIPATQPTLAIDSGGDFAIAWSGSIQGGNQSDIIVRSFNAAGLPQGQELRVNTFFTNAQTTPAIAMDSTGNALIAWSSDGQDGGSAGVYAQRYVRNTPPAFAAIPGITVNRDAPNTTLDVRPAFSDPEDATLTYALLSNSNPALFTSVTAGGIPGTYILDFAPGVFGTALFTVRAADSGLGTALGYFTVTVLPVITGTAGSDTFVVRRAGQFVEVFVNADTSAPPTHVLPLESLPGLLIQGGDGDDVLRVEGGIQGFRLTYDPGAGDDAAVIDGGMVNLQPAPGVPGLSLVGSDIRMTLLNAADVTLHASQRFASLTLGPESRLKLAPGADKALLTAFLNLLGGATLDLSDNALAVVGGSLTAIASSVASARNTSPVLWQGAGITSSAAGPGQSLASVLNNDGAGAPLFTSLHGLDVPLNAIIVAFTTEGDLNLDGRLDIRDYFSIDAGRAMRRIGWAGGDVNYSGGPANADDYMLIDRAFLSASGPLSTSAPAPLVAALAGPNAGQTAPADPTGRSAGAGEDVDQTESERFDFSSASADVLG